MGAFDSPCAVLAVVGALLLAGRKATEGKDALRRWGGVAAIAVVVLTLASAPAEDDGEVPILIVAAVRGGLTLGAAWLLLAAATFLYGQTLGAAVEGVRSRLSERRRAAEATEREQSAHRLALARIQAQERREAAERERIANLPPPPPPPTVEEQMAAAQARFQAKVKRLMVSGLDEAELNAAITKAKQQMLRDIDEVMQ